VQGAASGGPQLCPWAASECGHEAGPNLDSICEDRGPGFGARHWSTCFQWLSPANWVTERRTWTAVGCNITPCFAAQQARQPEVRSVTRLAMAAGRAPARPADFAQSRFLMLAEEAAWPTSSNGTRRSEHGVTFDGAPTVFGDPPALLMLDPEHSVNEQRYLLLGMSSQQRLCVEAFAARPPRTRLISARRATPRTPC
jgi:uncharacterized DUF497 family protein